MTNSPIQDTLWYVAQLLDDWANDELDRVETRGLDADHRRVMQDIAKRKAQWHLLRLRLLALDTSNAQL